MAQYLLAIHRDYAVPLAPEATGQKWADINALIDKMSDAGAFVFQGGLRGGARVGDRGAPVWRRLPDD